MRRGPLPCGGCYSERGVTIYGVFTGMRRKHHAALVSDQSWLCQELGFSVLTATREPLSPRKLQMLQEATAHDSRALWAWGLPLAALLVPVPTSPPPPAAAHSPHRLPTPQPHRGLNARSRMSLLNGAYVT